MKRTRNFVSNFTRSKKPKLVKPKSYAPVKREGSICYSRF